MSRLTEACENQNSPRRVAVSGGGRSVLDLAQPPRAPVRSKIIIFSNIFQSFICSDEAHAWTLDCFVPLAGRPDAPPTSDLLQISTICRWDSSRLGTCGYRREAAAALAASIITERVTDLHASDIPKRYSRPLTRNFCRPDVSGRHRPHLRTVHTVHTSLPLLWTWGQPC